jgi:hypothetical protein
MPENEHSPASLDEVISEIATILARGYLRHQRRLAANPPEGADSEEYSVITEN